jgi:mitochondrial inner membrane protein COX18
MFPLRLTSGRYAQLRLRPRGIAARTAHHPPRRTFHLAATFNQVATTTAEAISSVHNAGLPWYITIPLVAVVVNFTARLPLQYYARRLLAKRMKLEPLVKAWQWKHIGNLRTRNAPGQPVDQNMALKVTELTQKSQKRVFKSFGVQQWKSFTPLVSMVPFVLVSESLRRLCGVSVRDVVVPTGQGVASDAAAAVSSISTPAVDAVFDPSLAQGGLLWFTDLIVADPYCGLPILCSAVLAWGSWGKMTKQQLLLLFTTHGDPGPHPPMLRAQRALQRLLIGMPLVPLILSHLPAAIFLYWLANFSLTHVNDHILSRLVLLKRAHLESPSPPGSPGVPKILPYLPASYPPGTTPESGKVKAAETV